MRIFDKDGSEGLDPATPEEVEWAFERAAGGFANDMIRRGVVAAADEDEALRFVRYHQNGGGCGPSGPGGEPYWYDHESDGCHAWFGTRSSKPLEGTFVKGERYVKLPWKQVIRRVRDEAAGPTLF